MIKGEKHMRKSFIRAAVVLGLSSIMTVNTFAATFKDVQTTHWAYPSIQYMYEKNYMVPNSLGEFKPNATMDYFEVAEVLAKATGYLDETIVKDMDPGLKEQIRKNYQAQKPALQKFNGKYKTWRNSSNEEIAYLLGKGYITQAELSSFMSVDKNGKEIKNTVAKEDLAVYLVRIMYKEATAKKEYKPGAFTDESKIAEYKRPHVAYLKAQGIIKGDAKGAFGGGQPVTKALCAKMTTDVLKKAESQNGESNSSTTPAPSPETGNVQRVKIKNIVEKGVGERYVLVEFADKKPTFCIMKTDTVITVPSGAKLTIDDVAVGAQAKVVVEKVNGSDYITKMELVTESTGGGSSNGGSTSTTTETYKGIVEEISRREVTIKTSSKSISYPISADTTILVEGKVAEYRDVEAGDEVTASVKNGEVTRLIVTKVSGESTVSGIALKSKAEKRNEYILTLEDKKGVKEVPMPKDVKIKRNGKTIDFVDLKTGDDIELTMEKGEVTRVDAEGKEQKVTGTLKAIHLAAQTELVIQTEDKTMTVVLAPGAELYDKKDRRDITAKELRLFSEVTVELDSKEVIALTVTDYVSKTNEKGIIKVVGAGAKYIDVLVEYDAMTDTTMVMKRIDVPTEVSIIIKDKEQYRSLLKEGMEVLITYDYGVSMNPTRIEVLR